MRSICLVLLMVGCGYAAQTRSPVYSPAPKNPLVKLAEQPIPAAPASNQQAQAREGTAPGADASATAPGGAPNQNYLVYYYPSAEYRNVPQQTAVTAYGNEPSFFSRIPWTDVAYVAASLVLVAAGGTMVYNGVGTQVKARAVRELQGITYDDASQMARRVLRAIEKFQNLNVETQ